MGGGRVRARGGMIGGATGRVEAMMADVVGGLVVKTGLSGCRCM